MNSVKIYNGLIFFFITSLLYSTTLPPTSHGKLLVPTEAVIVGGSVAFDGSLSSDNDSQDHGFTPRWSWDFSYNGTFQEDISTTSAYADWIYGAGGTYTVGVKYYDNDGEEGNIYTFTIIVNAMHRVYYLKDHLGSVRMTVQGGRMMIQDDFSTNLSQWTTTLGSGFSIINGEVANSSSGTNILVNASSRTLDDGMVTVDVKNVSTALADPCIVVRYQDANNYYMIHPYNNYIAIYEVIGGVENWRATGNIATIVPGQSYRLQITLEGGLISVCWNGAPIVSWNDATPWLSGKVGFHQYGYRSVKWDNITVWTNGPGKVIGYDDYDPWGMVLAGRSSNSANPNDKDKFTGKERDNETGLDYFGARYYDSWRGQWLQMDPLMEKYPNQSPYNYTGNNPIAFIDPNGKYRKTSIGGVQLYSRWTTEEAVDNMFQQSYLGYGIIAFTEQLIRNDPSYRPSNQEIASSAFIETTSHFLEAQTSSVVGFVTSLLGIINVASQGLSKTEMFKLALDEAIFEGALNTKVDGIPLAVKAGIGEGGKIIEDPDGNGTLMMINPKLKKKWGAKYEEKFDEKINEIRKKFLDMNFRIFDSRQSNKTNDPYDTSSGFNVEHK